MQNEGISYHSEEMLSSNHVIASNTTLFFLQAYHSLDPLEILSGR